MKGATAGIPAVVQDVHITTATVEIQVIRIGTKQMTLAVFRQLPYKDIFDNCGRLLSTPWGWVNYEVQYGAKNYVFVFSGILYRTTVNTSELRNLKVKPETKDVYQEGGFDGKQYITSRMVQQKTGFWRLDNPRIGLWLRFETEDGAAIHLENRLATIPTFESAPQLFIAV